MSCIKISTDKEVHQIAKSSISSFSSEIASDRRKIVSVTQLVIRLIGGQTICIEDSTEGDLYRQFEEVMMEAEQ